MFVNINERKINKKEMVDRIIESAQIYKNNLCGKSFYIMFEGKSIEVMFKSENFLHFTGVESNLFAIDFYKKALNGTLKSSEIGFSKYHPYRFADLKTQHLKEAFTLFKRDSLIITDLNTESLNYNFGATDFELVFGFNDRVDENNIKINNFLVPQTLRVEEITNDRYKDIYEVDYILSKDNSKAKYEKILFGIKEDFIDYIENNNIELEKTHILKDLIEECVILKENKDYYGK